MNKSANLLKSKFILYNDRYSHVGRGEVILFERWMFSSREWTCIEVVL